LLYTLAQKYAGVIFSPGYTTIPKGNIGIKFGHENPHGFKSGCKFTVDFAGEAEIFSHGLTFRTFANRYMSSPLPSTSLVIATYNWPQALELLPTEAY
jgi:hypothetical protein